MALKKTLIALFITISYILVFAQETPSFIPARPAKNLYIVVDEDAFVFPEPSVVKVIFTIEADSTVTYVNIMNKDYAEREDWKEEMMTWKFVPAMQDSVQVQSNEYFDVQLLSKEELKKEKGKVGFSLNEAKAGIVDYANKKIKDYYTGLSLLNPGVYTSNLHFAGPHTAEVALIEDNFSSLSSVATPIHRLKTGFSGSRLSRHGDFYIQEMEYYPYQPALTTIYSGLGENDHNIAEIGFMKNNTLGIKNLLIRADLHFEYGYWGNAIETSGNNRVTANYRTKWGDVSVKYKRLNQEIPSLNIMPVYGLGTYDVTRQKGYTNTTSFESKYFVLAQKIVDEEFEVLEDEGAKFKTKTDQVLIGGKYKNDRIDMKLNYEYVQRDANYDIVELYQDNPDSKHIITFKSAVKRKFLRFERILQYKLDPDQYSYQNELYVPIFKWLELRGQYSKRDRDRSESGSGEENEIYKDSFDDYTEAYTKQQWGAGLKLMFSNLKLELITGLQETYNFQQDMIGQDAFIEEYNEEDLYAKLNATLGWSLLKFDCVLANSTIYQKKIDNLYYYPELQTKTTLDCRKQLEHDNALKTGLSSFFVSEYQSERGDNPQYFVLDWYIGFEITKIFELRGYVKNVLNEEEVLRRNLLPRTYMATMQWNFIN